MIKLQPIYETLAFKDISDETYFSSEYCEYVSNSKLSLINPDQGGSVEKFKEGFKASSDSLILGSAVHELILQPEEFELNEQVDRPTAKLGMMADKLFPVFKAKKDVTYDDVIKASDEVNYYKGKMTKEKVDNVINSCTDYWQYRVLHDIKVPEDRKEQIYLDPKSREKCKACVQSLMDNKDVQNLLHPTGIFEDPISMNEAALFIDFKAIDTESGKSTILKFKAKLDNFTVDLENNALVLNDLKTTGHYLPKFRDSMDTYHYWRQMGAYSWLMKAWCMKNYNMKSVDSLQANMLVVSTIPEFKSGVFRVDKEKLVEGWREYVKLMKLVAELYISENNTSYVL